MHRNDLIEHRRRRCKELPFALLRFLTIAICYVSELDTQLEIARRLNYLLRSDHQTLDNNLTSNSRMLITLRKSVRSKLNS